jgi:hypothetical protein
LEMFLQMLPEKLFARPMRVDGFKETPVLV